MVNHSVDYLRKFSRKELQFKLQELLHTDFSFHNFTQYDLMMLNHLILMLQYEKNKKKVS